MMKVFWGVCWFWVDMNVVVIVVGVVFVLGSLWGLGGYDVFLRCGDLICW